MSSSRFRRRVALAAVVYAVLLAQVLLYPGVDTLVAALGAETTDLDASMWFLTAEFAAFVVFAVPWGAASDAAGRRVPFVAGSALLGSLGYALLAVLPVSFGTVLALRALQGAATVGAFSLSMTMLMDLEGPHGRNMGAGGIAIGLGTATGAPLGGALYELGPLVPLYAASGIFCALAVAVPLLIDDAPLAGRSADRSPFDGLRRTPRLALPYAFGFVDRLTAGFFSLVGTLYFRTVFGLSPAATGLTLALFFAPFALLQYPFGVVSDRIGRRLPIVAGSALYGGAVILVGAVTTVRAAQAAMVVVGVLGALMVPATMAFVTDLADPDERGVAMAGFNIAGSVGFLAGILLGGVAADAYGYPAAFLLVGGLELVVAAVTIPAFLRVGGGGGEGRETAPGGHAAEA